MLKCRYFLLFNGLIAQTLQFTLKVVRCLLLVLSLLLEIVQFSFWYFVTYRFFLKGVSCRVISYFVWSFQPTGILKLQRKPKVSNCFICLTCSHFDRFKLFIYTIHSIFKLFLCVQAILWILWAATSSSVLWTLLSSIKLVFCSW